MNKIIIGAFAMCMYVPAIAQHKTQVPAKVAETFAMKYPEAANTRWEKEKSGYEVSFRDHGQKMSAVYTAAGDLTETETAIAIDALPPAAKKYAAARGKITEAARILKQDGTRLYEAEVNHTDLLFDEKGNFVREHKD